MYQALKTSEIFNPGLYIISNNAILFKNAYEWSGIQLKERIDSKREIERMFSADNFDFYSNFWNIGETIGLSWGDPECIIKKKKIFDVYLW